MVHPSDSDATGSRRLTRATAVRRSTFVRPASPRFRFVAVGASDRGPRDRNDDSWLVRDHLLALADGVGGRPAGRRAADLAVRTLYDRVAPTPGARGPELVDAVRVAHDLIVEQGRADAAKREMACTLDAAVLGDDACVVGVHVGDSRAYVCRTGGPVEQVTEDEVVDGALVQSLGGVTVEVAPRLWRRPVRPGDRVVLASDGLWSGLGDNAVLALLHATSRLAAGAAVPLLLDAALAAGATDNVTLIVADLRAQGCAPSGAR